MDGANPPPGAGRGDRSPIVRHVRPPHHRPNGLHPDDAAASFDDSPAPAIPDIVIRRLPIYVRTLELLAAQGIASVSSDELAQQMEVTAAQIRRDLSYFGRFGKQGKGYDTAYLARSIAAILGLDRRWTVALAGYGNLGRAIAQYRGFAPAFTITAIFDQNATRIGERVGDVTIEPLSRITEVVTAAAIPIGIIAVPAVAAQAIADQMIAGGVRAILNYAPIVLHVPPSVTVREIDPVSALQSMTFYLVQSQ